MGISPLSRTLSVRFQNWIYPVLWSGIQTRFRLLLITPQDFLLLKALSGINSLLSRTLSLRGLPMSITTSPAHIWLDLKEFGDGIVCMVSIKMAEPLTPLITVIRWAVLRVSRCLMFWLQHLLVVHLME